MALHEVTNALLKLTFKNTFISTHEDTLDLTPMWSRFQTEPAPATMSSPTALDVAQQGCGWTSALVEGEGEEASEGQDEHDVEPEVEPTGPSLPPRQTSADLLQFTRQETDLLSLGSVGRQVTDQIWPTWEGPIAEAPPTVGELSAAAALGAANPAFQDWRKWQQMAAAAPAVPAAPGGVVVPQGLPAQFLCMPMMQDPWTALQVHLPASAPAPSPDSAAEAAPAAKQPLTTPAAPLAAATTGPASPAPVVPLAAAVPDAAAVSATPAPPPPPPEWSEKHTVMMRNLPNKYTQHLLLQELAQPDFQAKYDFLYLPIDPETHVNRGYAFINFISPSYAYLFKSRYEGKKLKGFSSDKVLSIVPAALQGFEANYAHYAQARVTRGDPSTRPLFLRESESATAKKEQKRSKRRRGSLIDQAVAQQRRAASGVVTPPGQQQPAPQAEKPQAAQAQKQVAQPPAPVESAPDVAPQEEHDDDEEEESEEVYTFYAKFCPFCGGKCDDNAHVCRSCGKSTEIKSRQKPKSDDYN